LSFNVIYLYDNNDQLHTYYYNKVCANFVLYTNTIVLSGVYHKQQEFGVFL